MTIRSHSLAILALAIPTACYRGGANAHADGSDGGSEDAGDDGDDDGGSDDDGGDPGACSPAALDMRRMTEHQYRRAIDAIFTGHVEPSSQFPAPSGKAPTGYSTELGLEDVGEHDVEQIVYAAEDVAEGVAGAMDDLLPCAADEPSEACAGEFLDVYGRRAYRRALTDDERAQLLATWQAAGADGATFAEAVALMVDELLQTPQFLYVSEYAAPTARPLEGFEIASRLSFLLWDSIPDDELLDLAEAGGLAERADVLAQAERMLESPNADTTVARLFREWTQTKQITVADKSTDLFPFFDADLATSMNESFDRFVVGTLRDGGSLGDVFRSSDAWVDPRMAEFFGVTAPADGGWARASLDADLYRGIWTQPALLASLAHSDRTSYVYRGVFVRKRVLCETLPPPPPDAMGVPLDLPPDPTAREESEVRIARAECGACHSIIDGPGLALEPFDAVGRWSPTDALGRTIDPSGTLVGVGEGSIEFTDHADMIDQLAAVPEVEACFARQLFRFSMSRMETEADECTIAAIEAALAESDGDLGTALVAIVGTDAYRQREAP